MPAADVARSSGSRSLIAPHNDAIIAENFDVLDVSPKPSCRALPCTGVSDEQISDSVAAHDAGAVQLNRLLLRKAMHDQEFVQGVRLEWNVA